MNDSAAQAMIRRLYLILPLEMYGQPTLAMSAGKMLKKATTPLGVEVDTRSSAAERMMTWTTEEEGTHGELTAVGPRRSAWTLARASSAS